VLRSRRLSSLSFSFWTSPKVFFFPNDKKKQRESSKSKEIRLFSPNPDGGGGMGKMSANVCCYNKKEKKFRKE